MSQDYVSYQGVLSLAEIVNGVAGAEREVGNVPDFQFETDGDQLEHQESMTGARTTDFTMTTVKKVNFSATLEEVNPENLAYILNGTNTEIAGGAVTDQSIGTVVVGQKVALGAYNVSSVIVKDSTGTPVVVNASKYTLDASFGTLVFNDVTGLTMPLKVDYTAGTATATTINANDSKEYELTFRGINTVNQKKVELKLWRTKKDPKATFPMIHEELGKYEIAGMALSDITKAGDAALGLYGRIVNIDTPT